MIIKEARKAVELWRGESDSLVQVSESTNLVYTFEVSGKRSYLRLTSKQHRPLNQLEGEMDFISYLSRGGVNVSRPISSINGKLIEPIGWGELALYACSFSEVEGEPFTYGDREINLQNFFLRGKTLGQI